MENSATGNYITDLTGIQYFDDLRYLDCSKNGISDLSMLPPWLDTLICNGQRIPDANTSFAITLHNIDNVPGSLHYLDCSNNGINIIGSLPVGLRWLDCSQHYRRKNNL